VAELEIPEIVDDRFRDHYRELILGSIKRTAEAETVECRKRGHRVRRRRIEQTAALLGGPPPAPEAEPAPVAREVETAPVAPPPVAVPEPEASAAPAWPAVPAAVDAPVLPVIEADPRSKARLRLAIRIVWVATAVLLACDVVAFGLESWATGAADVGLIVLTLVWFAVTADEVAARRSVVLNVPEADPWVEPEPVAEGAPEPREAEEAEEAEGIEGVRVTSLHMQRDAGGHMSELFGPELREMVGFEPEQWQMHVCRAGTLRGMHAHARRDDLRIVVEGRVALGLKDLREGSPSEGRSDLLTLTGDEYAAVVIPAGVAYGIFAQTDALVLVGATADDGSDEYGCAWNDPALGIAWPGEPQFLSERDRKAGPLEVLAAELQPQAVR
jgi:dTDP-4-dehydrorhamnose 3,5-epimerase